MLVYACIGLDTRIIVKTKELEKGKSNYSGYVFLKTDIPEYMFGYPLYSSKTKIPDRLKKSCKIKAIKTFDKELQEAIKQREYLNELSEKELGFRLDDPFNLNFDALFYRRSK